MAKAAAVASRITEVTGFRKEQSVVEYTLATAEKKITYPGIAQCITVTGYRNAGLLGTHISPGATRQELDEQLSLMASRGIKFCREVFVVGNMDQHVASSTAIIKNTAVLLSELAKAFKMNGPFWLCNTSPLLGTKWGIDIIATWTPVGVNFKWKSSLGAGAKLAPEDIDEPFVKYFGSQA